MLLSTEPSQKPNRASYYKAYNAAYNATNKDKRAAYRAANKDKIVKRQAAYDAANKEKLAAYRVTNKEKLAATRVVYRDANKVKILFTQKTNNRNRKLALIEHMGGKCKDCLGTFPPSVYEFHHVDPSIKDAKASIMFTKGLTAPVIEELKKCVMLCANCHRIRHATLEL